MIKTIIGTENKEVYNFRTQPNILEESKNKYGDNVALSFFKREITYGQLFNMVNGVSRQLSEKINKGDVVILSTQNIPQFIIAEYAIWNLGGIVLPVNPLYSKRELDFLISDSNAKLMIASCESTKHDRVELMTTNPNTFFEIPYEYKEKWKLNDDCEEMLEFNGKNGIKRNLSPSDIALLVYTSGTTGIPKGVPITHSNIYASSFIYKNWFAFSGKDKVLGIAPFFHITGQIFHITTSILSGSSISTLFRFDPNLALQYVEDEKTTLTMSVATAYRGMLNALDKQDLSSMRMWSSGGMPMPEVLEEEWKKKVGSYIYMAWGLTETTSPATLWPYPYDGKLPVDNGIVSSGIPVYETQIEIREDDEIFVRGPQVVKGYWKQGEFKDGWLPTGDVGKIIGNWVFIIDRKRDIIDTSGFKVMPREVEESIYKHKAVDEVAVVGMPDSYRGEAVIAYVKLKDGYTQSEALAKDIINFCRINLAPYKVPREIRFVSNIPKTPSGKIMRRTFKEEENTK
ncbi:AMP-binding protein [Acidianus sp. RZ1]|uniref:AMP-binding protein n=1 Tax=Acidianus sp. RZ1 TaxID=1540082 RepID=UPI00353048A8